MILFAKAIASGILFVIVVFAVQIGLLMRQQHHALESRGLGGQLGATAGGWEYVLRQPLTAGLVTVAFGLGFWLVVRR